MTARPTPAAAQEPSLGMLLKQAEQTMVRRKTAVLKRVGLSLAQFVALGELDKRDGTTAASLARACLVSPQAMMVVLKTMEQQGLIVRSPHPRHVNVLELHMTEVGREALLAARRRVDPIERRVLDAYNARELASFRSFLTRFTEAMDTK